MYNNGGTGHNNSVSQASSCCSSPHGQRMYSERSGALQVLTSSAGRIALIGATLACIHCAGLVISLYYLISNYLSTEQDDPYTHICTDALLCILFRFGPTREHTGHTSTALAGQLLYSLVAVSVNLLLVAGAMGRKPLALVGWLFCYLLNIGGCLVLTGVLTATLVHRHQYFGDIQLSELGWISVPVLLCVCYLIVWIIVFFLFSQIRREHKEMVYLED